MSLGRRDQVIQLMSEASSPLDDDEIASRLAMNHHYVNQICRQLAAEGLIKREPGPLGKLLNQPIPQGVTQLTTTGFRTDIVQGPVLGRRSRTRRHDRARANVEALVHDFDEYTRCFEGRNRFGGPSRYFHDRAIERRRCHDNLADLLADKRFLEYVYAVLPAWGMHRMGKQAAKVGEFDDMVDSFRAAAPAMEGLWPLRITDLPADGVSSAARQVWDVIASLRVSTSETRIVAGSKALHHVLPDLVPPIDRQYTFRFFTGQKAVQGGDERAFIEWFPYFVEIARRCRPSIENVLGRGGFMATSSTKVIDNAIIGFMQSSDAG